ncbi:TPA: distal tail protein Dit [Streptococcus pyogenes]
MTAFIKFDGKKSSDFDLRIINDVEHDSSFYDVDQVKVPGRDGVVLKDNKRLEAIERSYPLRLYSKRRLTEVETDISNWLNVKGWKDLELSWEPDYIYKATHITPFSIKEVLRNFGRLKINFLIHPIKYLKTGKQEVPLVNGGTLQNPGNVQAKPILKIKGTGNGVLTINDFETGLENVQGELVIDMERHLVYKDVLSAWDNIVRTERHRMPLFDVGQNKISWTGNFTVTAVPNWGVKV